MRPFSIIGAAVVNKILHHKNFTYTDDINSHLISLFFSLSGYCLVERSQIKSQVVTTNIVQKIIRDRLNRESSQKYYQTEILQNIYGKISYVLLISLKCSLD